MSVSGRKSRKEVPQGDTSMVVHKAANLMNWCGQLGGALAHRLEGGRCQISGVAGLVMVKTSGGRKALAGNGVAPLGRVLRSKKERLMRKIVHVLRLVAL